MILYDIVYNMLYLIIYWQCKHHSWFWKMGPFTPRPKIVERALSQGGLQMEHHSKRQNVRVSIFSSAWCLVFQIVPEWNKNSTYVWCNIMYVYINTNTYIHTCAVCINNIDPPHSKETKRQRMSSGETAFHVTRWAHHAFQLSEKTSAKGAWCIMMLCNQIDMKRMKSWCFEWAVKFFVAIQDKMDDAQLTLQTCLGNFQSLDA